MAALGVLAIKHDFNGDGGWMDAAEMAEHIWCPGARRA
jgi:hypothetical protein